MEDFCDLSADCTSRHMFLWGISRRHPGLIRLSVHHPSVTTHDDAPATCAVMPIHPHTEPEAPCGMLRFHPPFHPSFSISLLGNPPSRRRRHRTRRYREYNTPSYPSPDPEKIRRGIQRVPALSQYSMHLG